MLIILLFLLFAASSMQEPCSQEVHFSILTRRNRTGHWHTNVLWEHEQPKVLETDSKETGPISLDMKQLVQGWSEVERVSVQTKLFISPLHKEQGYGIVAGVGRYRFHATATQWGAARNVCSAEGGYLAIIRSKEQENALKAIFARHPKIEKTTWNEAAWIGIQDIHSEGDFITVHGESFPYVGYSNWEPGKPNNFVYDGFSEDSDCVAMKRTGQIMDLPCSAKYAFICEQHL